MSGIHKTCTEEGCTGLALMPDGKCWNHSACITDEDRQVARAKGGKQIQRRFAVTVEDLEEFKVDPTAEAALQCQLDAIAAMRATLAHNPTDTQIMSQLSLAAKRLSQQVMAVDIEARLRRIEEQLGKRKPRKAK